ncbi:hypothetical protein [Sulfuracidifex metallicus]|uniref:Uncharacterized protein n=1 Tax=Sulfuracidifex metallicus DSM 6482 = JCM 9184 TaxID=523847 RepID=A0A6A9QLF4_SULME|nr:hypothetical protein [Sulfuracidifex metallicus]MUN29826.1 hypothetical protein [Sulfuracidifex metallicus DSM 6482 = JCM 9184]WOE51788.1 hypothetical protein RQ359_001120 [Sulfuracidifex metallicus DSM 6482 = JCM 9184]
MAEMDEEDFQYCHGSMSLSMPFVLTSLLSLSILSWINVIIDAIRVGEFTPTRFLLSTIINFTTPPSSRYATYLLLFLGRMVFYTN